MHSIRQASRRKGFILACAVTRLAVSGYEGRLPEEVVISRACSTCGRPHGRPRVTPGTGERAVEISVSHSQRLVGVAVADAARLGIDLERVDADLDVGRLAELVLRPAEIAALESGDETGRRSLDPGLAESGPL